MSNKPLVGVVGATGVQGSSVIKYLLSSESFRLRGICRNTESATAQNFAAQGVEMVSADLDDLDRVKQAFRGCDFIYGVTNFWEHGEAGETRQGKNMVDAAKAEGVRHFVFSTMEHSGEREIWHFDSKARVNDYLIKSGIPRTSIYTAAYYENFAKQMKPKKHPGGEYLINFNFIPPDAKFFAFCGDEIGAWVTKIFLEPDGFAGKDLKLVADWLTTREMAATASRVTALDVRPLECTLDDLEKTQEGGYIYIDLYRMTRYYMDNPPESGVRDENQTRRLFPQASTWEDYVKAHKDEIFN